MVKHNASKNKSKPAVETLQASLSRSASKSDATILLLSGRARQPLVPEEVPVQVFLQAQALDIFFLRSCSMHVFQLRGGPQHVRRNVWGPQPNSVEDDRGLVQVGTSLPLFSGGGVKLAMQNTRMQPHQAHYAACRHRVATDLRRDPRGLPAEGR